MVLEGAANLKAVFRKLVKEVPLEVGRAMYQEGLVEQKEMMHRCPRELGVLIASHETKRPVYEDGTIEVRIECGGPAAPYARVQHESLDFEHPRGGEAKWMERTLLASKPHMLGRLAKRIDINRAA